MENGYGGAVRRPRWGVVRPHRVGAGIKTCKGAEPTRRWVRLRAQSSRFNSLSQNAALPRHGAFPETVARKLLKMNAVHLWVPRVTARPRRWRTPVRSDAQPSTPCKIACSGRVPLGTDNHMWCSQPRSTGHDQRRALAHRCAAIQRSNASSGKSRRRPTLTEGGIGSPRLKRFLAVPALMCMRSLTCSSVR